VASSGISRGSFTNSDERRDPLRDHRHRMMGFEHIRNLAIVPDARVELGL
jgi:hypothetical protein